MIIAACLLIAGACGGTRKGLMASKVFIGLALLAMLAAAICGMYTFVNSNDKRNHCLHSLQCRPFRWSPNYLEQPHSWSPKPISIFGWMQWMAKYSRCCRSWLCRILHQQCLLHHLRSHDWIVGLRCHPRLVLGYCLLHMEKLEQRQEKAPRSCTSN
jgi:hypothetical protein